MQFKKRCVIERKTKESSKLMIMSDIKTKKKKSQLDEAEPYGLKHDGYSKQRDPSRDSPEVVATSCQDDPVRREALPLHDEGDIAVLFALHQGSQLL